MIDLALYTESYPYHNTETFLETEIRYLSQAFESIYIIPNKGSGIQRTVPSNVRVYEPINDNRRSSFVLMIKGLLNLHLFIFDKNLRASHADIPLLKKLKYLGFALTVRKNIRRNLIENSTIHYSYWLNYQAFVLSLLKRQGKVRTFISRAHGYDLYMERGEKSLQFFQPSTINRIDRLFTVSEHGLNYLKNRYPGFSNKFSLARLGTTAPGFLNPLNNDNILKVVSCFTIRPVKRIQLILESLKRFSILYPKIGVQWDHLGGGDKFEQLKLEADDLFMGTKVKCIFHGNRSNSEIFEFYKSESADLFLNTSQSEGLPVSVMEAQSCGIPVIATDVGGTLEIVNNENGLLLDANPDSLEIARALNEVFTDKTRWRNKRQLSYDNWLRNFNADVNYKLFTEQLLSLAVKG